ncbi:hypothetical protein BBO99_00008142 [Phytophthora kernoviae]|uniref:Expansin-like EG45 domain-containing protein n=2 Tax=Phytophthora kernoviae TaxID=325452 RepID=A0A3R7GSB4_9STRA|nr:hypothetical protein G195_009421 [Phytophthora kernoviae 00238/432]KAG2513566.1 hypothetical protein JM16_007918 [Phytophthora kernoviae]KAG2518232.1 hypothetical protein JM18_007766 [Phytophthora kernoviae]RLN38341.1 hypothetical protein BBI17_008100 [Phytophthora kernoviae]RLN75682.1 hypothetical protein BBO99_00008142 [Phytophthora kernoviae]
MPTLAIAGGGNAYFNGDGTSYTLGQTSAGNCNFMYDSGVGDYYAALNNDQWDSTLNCGRCAEVSCDDSRCSDTTSTVTVWIVDRCPECVEGDLDLSPTVFKQLTGSDPSRYSIKWKFVDCPVSGGIEYCTKSGSSSSWLAVQPANMAQGVASMKIANQDVTMVDSCFYFLLNGGSNVDLSSVSVELTSVTGETVTETVSLTSDKCTQGSSNFGGSTSQTSQTAAPTPTTATPISTPSTGSSSSTSQYQNEQQTQQQNQQQQSSGISTTFTSLNTSSSDSGLPGKVTAADESSGVSILQSSEAGVEKTPTSQQDDSDSTTQTAGSDDTKQANTKSQADNSGTSPVIIALVVCGVVGGIALGAVAFMAKKKKLEDKCVDRDVAMARSFDTFSSPVRIQSTIAQI